MVLELSCVYSHRALTVCLRGRGARPLLDAVQMEDVEATLAAPHRGHGPDHVAAHHALVLLLRQLFNQAACGVESTSNAFDANVNKINATSLSRVYKTPPF